MARVSILFTLVCISLYISMLVDACPRLLENYPLAPQDCKIYEELKRTCEKRSPFVRVPETCNLYMDCVAYTIQECAPGTAFDDNARWCIHADRAQCGSINPCKTGKNITDEKTCQGYLYCSDAKQLIRDRCKSGEAFDTATGACVPSSTCKDPSSIVYVSSSCDPVEAKPDYYLEKLTRKNTVTGEDIYTETKRRCLYGNYVGDCMCDRLPALLECKATKVVDLSSAAETWSSHRQWTKGDSHSKLRGTAGVSTNPSFSNWAYFNGNTWFELDVFKGNAAGYYWSLSFSFQSMKTQGNNLVPGLNVGTSKQPVALVGNSVDGETCDPSLGCMLDVNSNEVVCYVRTRTRDGSEQRYQQSVTVDPTKTVSVELKRAGVWGEMVVTVSEKNIGRKVWNFNEDDAVIGTYCAGSIGSGKNMRNFLGFMDYVVFETKCPA